MERQSKVLVVDDDRFALRSMAQVLEGQSYQVVTAASGSEAIDLLRQDSFDLVVTDLKMPEVDGLEVLRQAREVAPQAEVFILTGYASLESAIEALREGAHDYLVKPCSADELKLKVKRGLERVRWAEERKLAQEALRESEERLRGLFETMAEGVILIAPDGQIIQANLATEGILGLPRSEIESRNYVSPEWEIFRPDGTPMPPGEMAGLRAMKEKHLVKDVVMGVKRPDGSISWISVSAAPLIDESGELQAVVCTFADITKRKRAEEALRKAHDELELRVEERTADLRAANEALRREIADRKRAEESLRESEEKYRLLVEHSGSPITLLDSDGIVLLMNATGAANLGGTSDGFVGKSLHELFPDRADELMERNRQVMESGVGKDFEDAFELPEGKRWFWSSIQPVKDASGKTFAVQIVSQDITARKQAEKALRHSLEEAAHAQRTLLALSQAAQAVQRAHTPEEVYRTIGDEVANLGYHAAIFTLADDRTHLVSSHLTFEPAAMQAAEKLAGLSMQDFRLPLVPGGFYERIIAEGDATFSESFAEPVAEALAGSLHPLAGRLAALLGIERGIVAPLTVGGEAHGLLMVTGTDVTKADVPAVTAFANQAAIAIENARLFDQVRAGRERLRWLTQQIVWAQEEERRRLSRELHDDAGQALTALKISLDLIQSDLPVDADSLRQRLGQAIALTETTMDRVRLLAHGLRPPALDAVGLNYTLEGLCLDFAEHTKLSIDYAGTELPVLPEAARITLYRFLQEALTNVAKHAHANQVWVALHYDGQMVCLSVEDDGQGFDQQARMSAGVGLLGTRERLELLGGQLEIESRPGQGTRLTACIPLEQAYVERRAAGDSLDPR